MSVLRSPGWIAALAALLAAAAHPGLRAAGWSPSGSAAFSAVALLLVLSLVAAAWSRPADRLAALGAVVVLLAVGYDRVRGHAGALALQPGQGSRTFDEEGPGGRPLGLRPFGFDVRLDALEGEAPTLSFLEGESVRATQRVTREQVASYGGFRFASPRAARGEAAALRLRVTGDSGPQEVVVTPGESARTGGLVIELERFFADFALDEKGKPYSRSAEARNPAALLVIRRGKQAWRVFVIRALPGIHRQEGLDFTFALLDVEPLVSVQLVVAREPGGVVAGAGLVVLAAGLALGGRVR